MAAPRFVLLATLFATASLHAGERLPPPEMQEAVFATHVDGMIEVGPEGTVVAYEPITELKAPLGERVRAMAQQLRFEPVVIDGKPVIARARIRMHLAAKPIEEGKLEVAIEDVGFPEGDEPEKARAGTPENPYIHGIARRAPVSYPSNALRMGLSGRVMVAVRLAPDGTVADAVPRESALFGVKGRERELANALGILERGAVDAIRRWRFDVRVPDGAFPKAEDLTGLINVEYVINDNPTPKPGRWLYESRSRERALPWLDPMVAERLPDMADLGEGGHFGTAAPKLKLVTPANGVAL